MVSITRGHPNKSQTGATLCILLAFSIATERVLGLVYMYHHSTPAVVKHMWGAPQSHLVSSTLSPLTWSITHINWQNTHTHTRPSEVLCKWCCVLYCYTNRTVVVTDIYFEVVFIIYLAWCRCRKKRWNQFHMFNNSFISLYMEEARKFYRKA